MKCLRLVCLVSLIVTPIFAAADDSIDDWEDLAEQSAQSTKAIVSDDCSGDDSDTEVSVTHRNDKIVAIQLSLLDMRTNIDNVFNALRGEHPNIDDTIAALSQCQCVLSAKLPIVLQKLQDIKELQVASAQSNGDNETKDNA